MTNTTENQLKFEASLTEIEGLTGVTFKTLKKRLDGLKPHRIEGTAHYYDLKKVLPLLLNNKEGEWSLTEERARLAFAQRKKLEIETEKLLGTFVDAEIWAEEASKAIESAKDKINLMSGALAPTVTQCNDEKENYIHLKNYSQEVLSELHRHFNESFNKTADNMPTR